MTRQTIAQAQAGASAANSGDIALFVRGAGTFHTHAMPPELVAAFHGRVEGLGATVRHILGRRNSFVASTLNDVCEFLTSSATFPELTGSEALEIVSTSSQDTVAGTGAAQVEVTYISADSGFSYQERTARFAMTGLTAVPCSFTAHAIQTMEVTSCGPSETTIGTITLRNVNSTALVYEQITAGGNKSLSARYMVPESHSAFIADWDGGAVNQDMDHRLRATCTTTSRELTGCYLFQATAFTPLNQRFAETLPYLKVPARGRIKASAIPAGAGANPRCDANIALIVLEENGGVN